MRAESGQPCDEYRLEVLANVDHGTRGIVHLQHPDKLRPWVPPPTAGVNRRRARTQLPQMDDETISKFITNFEAALIPSGHLILWVDKFHLCGGIGPRCRGLRLETFDVITWDKRRMGMRYRTRRSGEYALILQKYPERAKGVWRRHDIPDVWTESAVRLGAVHPKPVGLQAALIEAVTDPSDVVVDPAAGSYSLLAAAKKTGRNFLGCDVVDVASRLPADQAR